MSVDSAIGMLPEDYWLRNKLEKQIKTDKDDADVLRTAQRWVGFITFLRVLASIFTLGIVAGVHKAKFNKQQSSGIEPKNPKHHKSYIKEPKIVSEEMIAELKRLAQDTQYSDEENLSKEQQSSDSQDEASSTSSSKKTTSSKKNTSEELKDRREKFDHPLGPLHGGRYVSEDEDDKQTTYHEERSAATVLNNGNILACDPIYYKAGGHSNLAIGVFNQEKKLLKPLFRYQNPKIEDMVALEYAPEKFAVFYKSRSTLFIAHNNGRDVISLPFDNVQKIIPLQFEITNKKFNVAFLLVSDGKIESAAYTITATGGASLTDKTINQLVKKALITGSGDASHRVVQENISLLENDITTTTYHAPTSTVYVADSDNTVMCIPIEKFGENGLLNPANEDVIELKTEASDHVITHIAVSKSGQIIAFARENGAIEIYDHRKSNTLKKIPETFVDINGIDGEILDLKFVDSGDLIVACSKQTLCVKNENINEVVEHQEKKENIKKSSEEKPEVTGTIFEYAKNKKATYFKEENIILVYHNGKQLFFPIVEGKTQTIIPLDLNTHISVSHISLFSVNQTDIRMHFIDLENQAVHNKIFVEFDNIDSATYNDESSTLYVATSPNELKCIPTEKRSFKTNQSEENFVTLDVAPVEMQYTLKMDPSDHAITHIAISEEDGLFVLARDNGDVELHQLEEKNTLKKLGGYPILRNGVDGEILNVKFIDGDLFINCSKQSLIVPKADIDEILENKSYNKTKGDQAGYKEMRKRRSQEYQSDYIIDKSCVRKTSRILGNGDIFACDEVTFEDDSIKYRLGVFHSQYGISTGESIIKEMPKNLFFTPNEFATQFIPYQQGGELAFLIHDGKSIKVFEKNGNITQLTDDALFENSGNNIFMIVDSKEANHPILIETDGKNVCKFLKNDIMVPSFLDKTGEFDLHAAAYHAATKHLYFIHDDGILSKTDTTTSTRSHIENTKELQNVTHMAVSDSGKYMAVAKTDGTVTIYNIEAFTKESGEIKKETSFTVEGASVLDLRFVDEDRDLLIATDSKEKPAVRINNFEEQLNQSTKFEL